jgi:asparagine synthase (glutamine-hydrolysing)
MCGIAGIISLNSNPVQQVQLNLMLDIIAHRGPDGHDIWINMIGNVGLGHRRLSIIDLSNSASQPMHYLSRYTIVFNGEIYNYVELRNDLINLGYVLNNHSDTEVLLALYHFKKDKCLNDLDGMFAFVIWDDLEKKLFFARDRFGEKPLYYSFHNGYLYFASEMKALWAAGVPKSVNFEMLNQYFLNGLLHNPENKLETFYQNINKFPSSNYAYFDFYTKSFNTKKYWTLTNISYINKISEQEACEHFFHLFETSVKRRLRSDVPVGSSLSGGLDSSSIVCMINDLNKDIGLKQLTFSARFPGYNKDEGEYMQMVIDSTNVTPYFTYPNENGFLDSFEKIMYHQEEPFGSSSIFAQFEVMRLAKEKNVTVLLDGQGADEMLAGYHYYYPTYFNELKANRSYAKLNSEWKAYKHNIQGEMPLFAEWKNYIRNRMPLVKDFVNNTKSVIQISQKMFTHGKSPKFKYESSMNDLNTHLMNDLTNGNLENLLRYSDRNSMANSREVRLPYLFHELCEFIISLPADYKIRNGWTKWIQRKSLEKLMPQKITWRKDKIGYEPPQKKWMQDSRLVELIHESKRKLHENKVITNKAFNQQIKSIDANSRDNHNWEYLMGGNLFN